jgi:phage terminase small subunit
MTDDLHLVDSGRSDATPPDPDEALDARELALVEGIASGQTIREASTVAGVPYTTARRWRRRPEIQAAIRERAREAVEAGTLSLGQGASAAAKTLRAIASGKKPAEGPRVTACRAILEIGLRVLEVDKLTDRVERLEGSQRENLSPAEMAARFMRATRIAQEILAKGSPSEATVDAIEVGANAMPEVQIPAGPVVIEASASPPIGAMIRDALQVAKPTENKTTAPVVVLSSVPMPWAQPVQRLQHPQAQSQVGVIPSK